MCQKGETTGVEFKNKFQRLAQVSGGTTGIEDIWKSIKEDLQASSDKSCGCTKGPPRHRVTWWWTDNVDIAVKEKRRLWKSRSKLVEKKTTEAKRTARSAVYDAKRAAQLERFGKCVKNGG